MKSYLRRFLPPAAVLAVSLVPGPAGAVTQNFCGFPSALTTWTYNGNAFEALNSDIRLTTNTQNEAGSAFLTAPIAITATTSVHAFFRFQMGPASAGGDGLAFVMHNSTKTAAALGGLGSNMGYSGITPSVIVEFDTFNNGSADGNANHVGLMLNGSATHTAKASPSFTMAGGGVLNAWVDYDATAKTIKVYLSQTTTKPSTALISNTLSTLYSQLGSAGKMYVGFTSATSTGTEINEHDVLELEISTDGIPCTCEGDAACSGTTPACGSAGICTICTATNHTACTGSTPVCNAATNSCVGCLANSDCSGTKPVCDTTSHTCQPCSSDANCGGATPHCDTTGPNSGACVACVKDANCSPAAPLCNTTTNKCQQCLLTSDCGGNTPICSSGTCKPCASDTDCGGTTPACEVWGACGQCSATNASQCSGGTAVCDFPTGTCVGCEFNSDCSGNKPTCDTASHMCRACQTNPDCVGNPGGPSCVTTGMKAGSCVICSVDSDCTNATTPRCDTTGNLCVSCLSNTDCSGSTPVCDPTHICVQCLSNADCSGATPVCDTTTSTCKGCQNDYSSTNPGPLSCPSATLPACQPAGTALAGQCAVCSSLNNSACASQPATPTCIAATATCGCAKDTDCNSGSYCDTSSVSTGTCVAGCREVGADAGAGGTNNCATGEYCSKMDGTVGTCTKQVCNSNTDCSGGTPVCDTIVQPHVCVQCLNNPDCPGSQVCDTQSHCVECTSKQTSNCTPDGKGAACLAAETCGCLQDSDCGGADSGRVCDMTASTCVVGCRGTNGNGCPSGQTCSSTDGTVGTCQGGMSSSSSSGSTSSGAGGGGVGGAGAGAGSRLVVQSTGCGCKIEDSGDGERAGALAGLLFGLGMVLRRRSSRRSAA